MEMTNLPTIDAKTLALVWSSTLFFVLWKTESLSTDFTSTVVVVVLNIINLLHIYEIIYIDVYIIDKMNSYTPYEMTRWVMLLILIFLSHIVWKSIPKTNDKSAM